MDAPNQCDKCGTNHDGYPLGSLGAELRCVAFQSEIIGATHVAEQAKAVRRNLNEHRNQVITEFLEGDE